MKEHFKDWERKKFVGTHAPCRCCGCRDVLKTAAFSDKPGYVWIVVACAFCENSRGGYYRRKTEYHPPMPEANGETKMTHAEEKMAEEICTLRAALRSVSDRLDAVLEGGFPGKGRSQDDKESAEQWWEDNHSAVKRAREVLRDTAEYDGVVVR